MKTIASLAPLLLPLFSSLAAFITTAEARVEVEDIDDVELLKMADSIKNFTGIELDPTSLIAMLNGGTGSIQEVEQIAGDLI